MLHCSHFTSIQGNFHVRRYIPAKLTACDLLVDIFYITVLTTIVAPQTMKLVSGFLRNCSSLAKNSMAQTSMMP